MGFPDSRIDNCACPTPIKKKVASSERSIFSENPYRLTNTKSSWTRHIVYGCYFSVFKNLLIAKEQYNRYSLPNAKAYL